MSEEQTLIERLEKATGASRELDVEIGRAYVALHGYPTDRDLYAPWEDKGFNRNSKWCWQGYNDLPFFTSSLDAAMTLVPEGWFITASRHSDGWYVAVAPHSTCPQSERFLGSQKPAAIALCIAALKARATP